MKKTILSFIVSLFVSSWAFAGVENYSLQQAEVDALFAESQDVTLSLAQDMGIENVGMNNAVLKEKTVGGFLLRSFFCGFIALHRYYMGTGGKSMWWKYFCIPVAGGVANCGDFFWVLFDGKDALDKYNNNGEYFVWL